MFSRGEQCFYVDPKHKVLKCTVQEDEKFGAVIIDVGGTAHDIGTFHLFRTESAANLAAAGRKPK
jgi:hypothetical protein